MEEALPATVSFMNLAKVSTAVLFSVALLAPAANKSEAEEEKFIAWVQKRVQEVQPTRTERKFDQVGWAKDILDAERLAKASNRPIFLFTHDGRVNWGRC
jgi:hypothetical protein